MKPKAEFGRFRWLRWLKWLMIVALLVELGKATVDAPELSIRRVDFLNADFLPAGRLASYRRWLVGRSFLFFLAYGDAIRQELALQPKVADVRVDYRFPGTVVYRLRSRRPYLYIVCGKDKLVVDRSGVVFEKFQPGGGELPLVWIEGATCPALGYRLPSKMVDYVANVLRLCQQVGLNRVRKVYLARYGSLSLCTTDGIWIKIGSDYALYERLCLARSALDKARKDGKTVKSIDVRTIQGAVWKLLKPKEDE